MTASIDSRPAASADAWRWWEARRLRYNLGLAAAGWLAWGLFVVETLWLRDTFSISVSLTLVQGLIWLIAMGVANLLYLLGPVSEIVLRPAEPETYRRRMFGLGFWFSVSVPFLFPAFVLVGILATFGL
ncbi:MAG TPA: hypothetical protein VFF66_03625 [Brevundimonas sp.]|nr:hypothetical protein [Brevundimonas sp.]